MEPKFNPPTNGCDAELLCPTCKSEYLHHREINIFERNEDEKSGFHVTVDKQNLKTDTNLIGNPSSRRNGLTVDFSCENCGKTSILRISQHKGCSNFTFSPKVD